ncbi:hypothetical protein A0J48_017305 [Sphaerospermopsis aphanizomenoides BCCUSP55]|uniref:hypothetical protein n=1 Tax=Sphaerospermopsis aphanizomenoides TaxID=459663 RepID=UPI001906346A|nr:hypothetical protein [Sphaerospermopsis aphanizomenoides]MBK1989273.1 hypothetical protein [Sphaerospermopsis aphanizomenoides BCCUSP55]
MQTKMGKNLLWAILLISSSGQLCFSGINTAWASEWERKSSRNNIVSNITQLPFTETDQQASDLPVIYLERQPHVNFVLNDTSFYVTETSQQISDLPVIYLEIVPNIELIDTEYQFKIVQQKSLTDHVPQLSSQSAKDLLDEPITDSSEEMQKLSQGTGQEEQSTEELNEEQELRLRVRPIPLEELPPPPEIEPADQFQPIGYLRGYVGYFQSSNIFSTNEDQIEDGLIFSGLRLASAYFPLGTKTYVNGSIEGSLIRYLDQSQFDYNQVRFNLGVYQELSPVMYAELNLSNQQSFYANSSEFFAAGDRFLNENSVQLSLGRRDTLIDKLVLDSLYEFSANFSDPDRRSRIINSFWLSLSYFLQKPLQVGLNYQVNFSDFTEQDREDQFHRLFGHLNYRTSDTSNIYLQGGLNFGGSTTPNIDFSSWFFSVNYGFEIGRF